MSLLVASPDAYSPLPSVNTSLTISELTFPQIATVGDTAGKNGTWPPEVCGDVVRPGGPSCLTDWIASLPWDARMDLTFRVDTEECSCDRISLARAERRVKAFLGRLRKEYGKGMRVFAAPELQGRGVLHWHVLIRWFDGPPWLKHSRLTELWQYWRGWKDIDQSQGVEGYLWLVLVKNTKQAKYAAKYASKSRGEWLLMDVDRLPARPGKKLPQDKSLLLSERRVSTAVVKSGRPSRDENGPVGQLVGSARRSCLA